MWIEKEQKLKANQQNNYSRNKFFYEKLFHKKNISIISKVPFISFPIHMQIYVQNHVLRSLKIPGLLDCQFTNAEFPSSCSRDWEMLAPLAMPLFN